MTRFDSVWLKLGRAKQHIDDLEATITTFAQANPYPVVIEDDPQTGKRTAKIGDEPASIPAAVPLILGDAVHSIRTSLDYFTYAAVTDPPDITKVSFPIWRRLSVPTAEELQSLVKRQVPGASQQLRDALCALQPYQGGHGEQFWLLDQLDVIDKHRLLVTVGVAYRSFIIDAAAMLRGRTEWTKDLPPWPVALRPAGGYPLQAGTPLFSAGPEYFEKNPDLKFEFAVAFGEPQVLVGEPVVPTLRRLLDEVEGLLKRLIPLV
jgi:hypothetical protein